MEEGPVDPRQLAGLIGQVDRIVATARPFTNSTVLFESTDPQDISAFGAASEVTPAPQGWFCMCTGSPAVVLYRRDEQLATISNHHGRSMRCSLWSSDAELRDSEKWIQWFDSRGMPQVRQEFDRLESNARKHEAEYERWKSRMPSRLRELWEQEIRQPLPLHDALTRLVPDTRERILDLCTWFGSGEGSWFTHPNYETVASEILFHFSTEVLIAALETGSLLNEQREGAARFFCSWDFGQHRPNDRDLLPESLKARLLEHVRNGTDARKTQLVESVLGKRGLEA